MVAIPTNYKMGTGLAATIMGQQAGLEAEQQGLANLYKAGQVPTQILQGAESMALLNDPDYIKANTQFQLAATQAKLGDAEKQTAVNGLDRLLIQLQANPDPQAQQQVILQSFREKGVDPTSPMGQAILADPYGKTMEARDKLIKTLGYTPQVAGQERVAEAKGENALELAQLRGDIQEKLLGKRLAAGGGIGKYEFNTNKILMDAANGDPQAQQTVNLMAQMRGYAQSGGITIDPVTGQMVTKGSTMSLPYPDAGLPKQEQTGSAGGGSYNYVPGQGLQPVGGAAPAQRKPPVAGRQAATAPAQDNSTPYIKQGGGVVDPSTGKTYSYDEYVSSRLAQQYPYSDLKVK